MKATTANTGNSTIAPAIAPRSSRPKRRSTWLVMVAALTSRRRAGRSSTHQRPGERHHAATTTMVAAETLPIVSAIDWNQPSLRRRAVRLMTAWRGSMSPVMVQPEPGPRRCWRRSSASTTAAAPRRRQRRGRHTGDDDGLSHVTALVVAEAAEHSGEVGDEQFVLGHGRVSFRGDRQPIWMLVMSGYSRNKMNPTPINTMGRNICCERRRAWASSADSDVVRRARALAIRLRRTAAPRSPARFPAEAISDELGDAEAAPELVQQLPDRFARQTGLHRGAAQLDERRSVPGPRCALVS